MDSVGQLAAHLRGEALSPAAAWTPGPEDFACPDFADVKGQENVKRALEIAAAGGHNIAMVARPERASMLARRPSILDLTRREDGHGAPVLGAPCRAPPCWCGGPSAPHHTVSAIGGGGSIPRPGEISLAHNGVLFLDELPEFSKEALETLRQPLEDGRVQISRVSGTAVFPARFMLVCAMNPCKCGWYGYGRRCRCSPQATWRNLSRLSGPLLDRIDLFVEVPPLDFDALSRRTPAEPSAAIKARVDGARAVQAARFGPGGPACNDQMGPAELSRFCALDDACRAVMKGAFDRMDAPAATTASSDGAHHCGPDVGWTPWRPGRQAGAPAVMPPADTTTDRPDLRRTQQKAKI